MFSLLSRDSLFRLAHHSDCVNKFLKLFYFFQNFVVFRKTSLRISPLFVNVNNNFNKIKDEKIRPLSFILCKKYKTLNQLYCFSNILYSDNSDSFYSLHHVFTYLWNNACFESQFFRFCHSLFRHIYRANLSA